MHSTTNLCPGVLAAVYGTNFGSTTSAVTISVGGKPGYVAVASPNQLNVQIPFEASTGSTTVTVTVAGTTSAVFPLTLAAVAPSIPSVDASGSGSGLFESAAGAVLTSEAPAKPGDVAVAYVTGLGATNPPTATSATPVAGGVPVQTPTLTIGGQPATIKAAVMTQYPGTYQLTSSCRPVCKGPPP
jgi:uncharacterized protein (TIGR03437 family)